jgi:O-antigen/teichoic acid export membrane protein
MTRYKFLPHIISALAGFVVCLTVSLLTGKKEAWDSGYYFAIGLPAMCALMFAISCRWPEKTWRWAFSMAVGQALAMAIAGNSLSLWPLSIIAMTVCSVPQFITGLVTSKLVRQQ